MNETNVSRILHDDAEKVVRRYAKVTTDPKLLLRELRARASQANTEYTDEQAIEAIAVALQTA